MTQEKSPNSNWVVDSLKITGRVLPDSPLRIVDVGAVGAPPPNVESISSISTYLGFDPDLRIPQTGDAFGFLSHTLLDQAITASDQPNVKFNLTEYPECSSTLIPNHDQTDRYVIGEFFKVVSHQSVPAITLSKAISAAKLDRVDWLKLDTQGTDLDILQSVSAQEFRRLLVVDLEPGVTAFYQGENRFSDIHEYMLKHGFWLADLSQQRFARISLTAVKSANLSASDIETLNRNPFAVELQYFRTVESLRESGCDLRSLLALWFLAMTNGHFAFAIEVAVAATDDGLSEAASRGLVTLALRESRRCHARESETLMHRLLRLCLPPVVPKLIRKVIGKRRPR